MEGGFSGPDIRSVSKGGGEPLAAKEKRTWKIVLFDYKPFAMRASELQNLFC